MLVATQLGAAEVTRIGLETAAAMCIYTNDQISIETVSYVVDEPPAPSRTAVPGGDGLAEVSLAHE